MPKRYTSITINKTGQTLEKFYQDRLDYLDATYHDHPTHLTQGLTNDARIRADVHRTTLMEQHHRELAQKAGLDIDTSSIAELHAAGICDKHGLT